MKKASLAVLLVFPFVIAFLGVTAIVGTFNLTAKDIDDIEWDYNEMTGFKIQSQPILLNATQVYDSKSMLAADNDLIWTVKNVNEEEEEHAYITHSNKMNQKGGYDYYLHTVSEGDMILSVRNRKDTVSRSTTIAIYSKFALIANPVVPASNTNIDPYVYYGTYDLDEDLDKIPAVYDYKFQTVPSSTSTRFHLKECTSNIHVDLLTGSVTPKSIVNKEEVASFTVSCTQEGVTQERSVTFKIVKDAVNVYSYDELLACTNKSETGEAICLRKNFESLSKYGVVNGVPRQSKEETELFGSIVGKDVNGPLWNFSKDAYSFKTFGNTDYIDQWNAFTQTDQGEPYAEATLSDRLYAGLRVQKDFYGNGYTINFHNLAYPYASAVDSATGVSIPMLSNANLFRGPLFSYCLGDPVRFPIIGLYGQDNVGMLVDGNDILINDVNVKNCDSAASLSFLNYTGTVLETHGDNITIKNSILSNGKNVVRSFSCKDMLLENCMLQSSYNFLLDVGTNEVSRVDPDKEATFMNGKGADMTTTIERYLTHDAIGDQILNSFVVNEIGMFSSYVTVDFSKDRYMRSLGAISEAMSNKEEVAEAKGNVEVKDCYFSRSGVSSLGSEALFNGPFLYNLSPSFVEFVFSMMSGMIGESGASIIPLFPTNLAMNSYAVDIKISGSTDFYDYKDVNKIDLNGLLLANFSGVLSSFGSAADMIDGLSRNLDLDAVFPIKEVWNQIITRNSLSYKPEEGEREVNMMSIFYGGGPNLSKIDSSEWANSHHYRGVLNGDLLSYIVNRSSAGEERYWNFVYKLLEAVIGFEPFRFGFMDNSGYNRGSSPSRETLINNAGGM